MPRFVLLRHDCPSPSQKPQHEKPSHWDFMLEHEGVLRTWELRELPSAWATLLGESSDSAAVTAIPLPDHRLAYLDYEGPVSGDRGSVRCCDRGTYEMLTETEDEIIARLGGNFLHGTVRLVSQASCWSLSQNEE